MTNLILHVGPGKCGSSSIQQFFATQEKPCVQSVRYILLNPLDIKKLNCEEPNKSLLISFAEQLSENIIACDSLILSHEFLFQNPYAVRNICSLAKDRVSDITIIGYSRKQSDFLVSAYSQWFFRSLDRIQEVNNVLNELKIDVVLFTGIERQLIASISNDFYSARQLSEYSILNWYNSYNNIFHLAQELGAHIKCGTLPNKDFDVNLIEDFCKKARLTLHPTMSNEIQKSFNISFNHDVIEAINNAVTLGLEVSGPHEGNQIIQHLSSEMMPIKKDSSKFISNLKAYIDTYYLDSNIQLCSQYGLNEAYFKPLDSFSKSEILDIIARESNQRSLNKSEIIRNYQVLSAKMVDLCIKLAKKC